MCPFPSDNQVGNNSYVELAIVPTGSLVPTIYTLTTSAAAAQDDESISLSSDVEFELRDQAVIDFSDGTQAIVALPGGEGLQDVITVTTAPISLPVQPLKAPVGNGLTASVFAYRLLLGTTEVSPSQAVQSVDASDSLSGFGNRNVVVAADRTLTANGNRIGNDRCFFEILDPYLNEDELIQGLLYARAVLGNGDRYEGPVRASSSSQSNPNRALRNYQLQFTFQGKSGTALGDYRFTPGDAAVFAAA